MSDNLRLIGCAQQGDNSAMESLVENNMGLVWSVAKRFYNRGYEAEDIVQIGCIGLVKAIKKFDLSFDVQFSTYAVPMIMGEIKRFIRDDGMIKVSRSIKELYIKIWAVRESFTKKNGREPTVSEIAGQLDCTVEDVVTAMDAAAVPDSLQRETGDGDNRQLMDKIEQPGDFEGEVTTRVALQKALGNFMPRERQIIMLRYFGDKTQSQVAQMLGISQVQVSRIEKRTLEHLRKYLESG